MNNIATGIVNLTQANENMTHVIVGAEHAESLHRYLNEQQVEVGPIEEAVSRTIGSFVDPQGRRQVRIQPLDMTFNAEIGIHELERHVLEWRQTLPED